LIILITLIKPLPGGRGLGMNYIFMAGFLAASFLTSVIPHLGHLPGLSKTTSACIGQVYWIFAAGFTFLVLAVSATAFVEWAAKTLAAENKATIAINITFFMVF
jgi:hypothetical protein